MDTKILLAFFLALPNAETDLANDPALKQLRNKLDQVNQKPEITPKDWENIQGKLTAILKDNENNAALNQFYQEILAQLENVEITSDLLPTQAELEAEKTAVRKMGTLGYLPDEPPPIHDTESKEILNIGIVILSHDEPKKVSQTLLQRLSDCLKRKKGS